MNPNTHKNGCHDRKPFVTEYALTGGGVQNNFSADKPCQYTLSALGQADPGCAGCKWKRLPAVPSPDE